MKSFRTLLKNELKLNIRNINMVIFAVIMPLIVLIILGFIYGTKPAEDGAAYHFYRTILWRTMQHLHLCGRANGLASCRIRISGTKNFEAFSSYPCQSGKITFSGIFDLRYLLHCINAYLVSRRRTIMENKNTWFFPAVLRNLVFDYGIDFEYRIVSWRDCEKHKKRQCDCLYSIFSHADFFGSNTSL